MKVIAVHPVELIFKQVDGREVCLLLSVPGTDVSRYLDIIPAGCEVIRIIQQVEDVRGWSDSIEGIWDVFDSIGAYMKREAIRLGE